MRLKLPIFSLMAMFGALAYMQEPVLAAKNAEHRHKHSSPSSHHHKKNNWKFFGPTEIKIANQENLMQFNPPQVTGRIASMAIGHACNKKRCRLWVGTAGGGLWRTDNALAKNGPKWSYLGCHFGSAAIGSLVVDTNDSSDKTLYVGTGESNFNATSLAGSGLYKTTDGGKHFNRISTLYNERGEVLDFTYARGIGTIAVKPGDHKTIYVGTCTAGTGMTPVRTGMSNFTGTPLAPLGLYKTSDGGETWALVWEPVPFAQPPNPNASSGFIDTNIGVKKVQFDPTDATTVYVTAFGNNIYRSAPNLESGDATFKPIFIGDFGEERTGEDLAQFDVTVASNGRPRIYVGNGIGSFDFVETITKQVIYRFNDADVPASSMVSNNENSAGWIVLTTADESQLGATAEYYCASQCAYNHVILSPPGQPDTLYIGGSWGSTFGLGAGLAYGLGYGNGTLFSKNAGTSSGPEETVFHPGDATGYEITDSIGHVDIHAIVFNPENPNIVFVGSDGGVLRTNGFYKDRSAECDSIPSGDIKTLCEAALSHVPEKIFFINRDLNVAQLWGMGIDYKKPLERMLIGLQDNGTAYFDGSLGPKVFDEVNFADGTSALGFHPTKPDVSFSSFQSNYFFTNYHNSALASWLSTGVPIQAAEETASTTLFSARQLLTIDKVNPDTQFTGYEHVWRTQNNGGDRATLEANCVLDFDFTNVFNPECGDWVALGIEMSDNLPRLLPGTGPDDPLRNPGNLTSAYYGADRLNGIITAIGRAEYNRDTTVNLNTLWAGTSNGRLFISNNANNVSEQYDGRNVTFVRIDPPSMPARFVSAIEVDPNDEYHAFISYAGFSAIEPGDHIFEVYYHPNTKTATFTSLRYNLGDIPVNTIAYDSVTGDLYAGFDTGVKKLSIGSKKWKKVGHHLPVAIIPQLKIVADKRLLIAATHGSGVWYLNLND